MEIYVERRLKRQPLVVGDWRVGVGSIFLASLLAENKQNLRRECRHCSCMHCIYFWYAATLSLA